MSGCCPDRDCRHDSSRNPACLCRLGEALRAHRKKVCIRIDPGNVVKLTRRAGFVSSHVAWPSPGKQENDASTSSREIFCHSFIRSLLPCRLPDLVWASFTRLPCWRLETICPSSPDGETVQAGWQYPDRHPLYQLQADWRDCQNNPQHPCCVSNIPVCSV